MSHSKGIDGIKSCLGPMNYLLQLATQCMYIHTYINEFVITQKVCVLIIWYVV